MRCDMCQMNGIIRNMVCDDCEGGRNFDNRKVFLFDIIKYRKSKLI